MTKLVIVGLGPWGLCALERVISGARRRAGDDPAIGWRARVHVVEPAAPGCGVYRMDEPDYLILNNACGQMSLYATPTDGPPPRYGVGFYDWAVARGYRWVGDECRIDPSGRPLTPDDYLPRRIMGEYLSWFFDTLVSEAPAGIEIVVHRTEAVDVTAAPAGKEQVRLADGSSVIADHVIVTTGHTANASRDDVPGILPVPWLAPYPVTGTLAAIPAGSTVGVSGMGLVAIDVVTALTVGRGGSFDATGGHLTYRKSGHEPTISLFSRTGEPYTAKAVGATDVTGVYQPVICTPDALDALKGRPGARRLVDARGELFPLVFAEMQVGYYTQASLLAKGAAEAAAVRRQLERAWSASTFGPAVEDLATRYGPYDPGSDFFADDTATFATSKDYAEHFRAAVEDDLAEALRDGGSSPLKVAHGVLRSLRDAVRGVVEFGGLTVESYLDFQAHVRGRVKRLDAGPPALRSRQLLALLDAGVVRTPFGPSPSLHPGEGPGVLLESERLDRRVSEPVDWLVRGHLDDPTVDRSASPLMSRLYAAGRLTQLHYDGVPVGSVALTRDSHPIDARGRAQARLWVFGAVTEGTRYFTHYIPSPKSRIRAVEDIGACVEAILA